ncbi:MAG: hypothetical protein ACI8ZT_002613, partial [Bacteroidia bacterium]
GQTFAAHLVKRILNVIKNEQNNTSMCQRTIET